MIVPFNPENDVTESWTWQTDTITSADGTEQRICLLDTPLRSVEVTLSLVQDDDVRAMTSLAMGLGGAFDMPHYQHQTKLTNVVAIGDEALQFDASLTELRDGCDAIVFDRITGAYEAVSIAVLSADGCTLAAPMVGAWKRTASICPMWASYTSDNFTIDRSRPNNIATMNFSANVLDFIDPFLNEFNDQTLNLFNGLPVLERQPFGDDFKDSFATGASVIDFGMVKSIRNLWQHAQILKTFNFLCHRFSNRNDWKQWRWFADYCRGSLNPFYMPTCRPDFEIVGTIAGTAATLKGQDYLNIFYPFQAFKSIAITTQAGVHYTKVHNAVASGSNTLLTLDTALPAGAGYAIDQMVSFLLQMRLADDLFTLTHSGRNTTVALNLRTVDA